MGLVHIDNLEAGMLLAADTHDRNGRLLLTQGTELTSRHIRMFMTWGIPKIDIQDYDEPLTDTSNGNDISPELLKKAEEELKLLFRKNDLSYPAIAELFQHCLTRKARNENR